MGGEYGADGRGGARGSNHLRDEVVDGSVILKWIID
jgi:hypothetical protein